MNSHVNSVADSIADKADNRRIAGVLLHPTSLPSGTLDKDAFRWLDFMAEAGLQLWQVLPLGVPQSNLSPYQCYSAFAINPALLAETDLEPSTDTSISTADFQQWQQQQSYWLDDYALFMALKQAFENSAWFDWEDQFKYRNQQALQDFATNHSQQINAIREQQYRLYQRWQALRDYASERNISLFGDMPIFVAHDSADVWAHQDYFLLDDNGFPEVVAGVPPDYFSETGQRWGNPHFNWDVMQQNDFDWWIKRLKNHLQCFDLVRIDHFRGLEAVWMIDAHSETAVDGYWQKVPGDALLQKLSEDMDKLPLVAEDLGIITPEVNALREKYHLPGMSILQFAFDAFADNPHKPENIGHDRVVYTGTHDNDTCVGWFQSLDEETRNYVRQRCELEQTADAAQVCDRLIQIALQSRAQLAVIPLQDFLHLGSEARINIPGTVDGNWQWRFQWQQIPANLATQLRQKISHSKRLKNNA